MHPWLEPLPGLQLSAYFACIATGLALGTFVLRRAARREGLAPRDVFDSALFVVPVGAVGARLFIVFDDPWLYLTDPLELLSPRAGLVSWGALLGSLAAVIGVARWKGIDPWRLVDAYGPAMLFGQAFARLGCLASGCCHGRPADWPLGTAVPWAVRYHAEGRVPAELLAVPLHPSPLYESIVVLGLFAFLERARAHKAYAGQILAGTLGGYGLTRLVLEPLRGDLERGFVLNGWLSTGQVMGLLLLATAVTVHLWRRPSIPS